MNQNAEFYLNGNMQSYERPGQGVTYDTKTADGQFNYRFAGGDFRMASRVNERIVNNIVGYDTYDISHEYGGYLNFVEKDRLSHSYYYVLNDASSQSRDHQVQRADARVYYRLQPEITVNGGANVASTDYTQKATAVLPAQRTKVMRDSLDGGVSYYKLHTPGYLGPFGVGTGYTFASGFSAVDEQSQSNPSPTSGGGLFYTNNLTLSLVGVGLKQDTATFEYRYFSKRDHSPIQQNVDEQSMQLNASTARVPKTRLAATGTYRTRHSNLASYDYLNPFTNNSQQSNRALYYSLTADYTAASFCTLGAAAHRQQTTSRNTASLSQLESSIDDIQRTVYGYAAFNYAFTRRLSSSGELREEWRENKGIASQSHNVWANLSYSLRMLIFSFDYRWRQEDFELGYRSTSQSYYAKLSRPF